MRVFLSWSGERSKAVAQLWHGWLPMVIQAIDPFMSSDDIPSGTVWYSDIAEMLSSSQNGIICLTKENQRNQWILFEAGALARGLQDQRVCTFLAGLSPTDVSGPLSQFNHTSNEKESVRKLVRTLNDRLDAGKLSEAHLRKAFDLNWPEFESEMSSILKTSSKRTKANDANNADELAEVSGLEKLTSIVTRIERRLIAVEARPKPRPIRKAAIAKPSGDLGASDQNSLLFARMKNVSKVMRKLRSMAAKDPGRELSDCLRNAPESLVASLGEWLMMGLGVSAGELISDRITVGDFVEGYDSLG